MFRKSIFLTILFLLLPMLLSAQTTTGRIRGRITDRQNGEPLIGANVQVVGTSFGASTDANGEYRISNLPPAVYSLKITYIGYTAITVNNIRVSADLTSDQNASLPPEGVTVATVDVTAQRPLVNKSNTNAVRITTSEDIQDLPVRGLNNIIGLTAGVTLKDNTVFIRGGRLDEVGYYLEGVSITNPVTGGRAVTINQDAVEEIQVQAGGYTAEFGGANAGIIRSQLKTGPKDLKATLEYITDNIGFKSQNNIFDSKKRLGTYWYGYDELTATLGGPVFNERFRLFGLFNYNFQRDANPQPYPGINLTNLTDAVSGDTVNLHYPAGPVRGNQNRVYTYTGTFQMDFSPIIVRLAGTYTTRQFQNSFTSRITGNIANIFNNARIQQNIVNDGNFSVKITHIINPNLFYELTGGYFLQTVKNWDPYLKDDILAYGDSAANADIGFVWRRAKGTSSFGRYIRPTQINLYDFALNAPGNVVANYVKARREDIALNGALSWNIGKVHSLKVGGEFTRYTIRNYSFNNETVFSLAGLVAQNAALPANKQQSLADIYISRGVNAFGYDALGNKYDGGGVFAPKHPIFAAGYIQDRIEFRDLIINAGIRFDHINTDNYVLKDASRPELNFNFNTSQVYP
ncbi:MAG: TonB-dependent receptor, partial [Bacteroidota bacterium]|nr:TonB-dependent receptor [Bacteroidota bacterium]